MRILITRPRPDADPLADKLKSRGHTAFVEPLIDIVFTDGPPLDIDSIAALVFTSANGARAAARRTAARTVPVFAVGPATAVEATSLGFSDVRESKGDGVTALAAYIRATTNLANGTLLHVTGTATAGDLKTALAPDFTVRTAQLYDAKAAGALSGALVAELEASLIDAAMFFSPRTADLFAALVQAANLERHCRALTALALSPAVAEALQPLSFAQLRTAARATTEAMLDLLPPA